MQNTIEDYDDQDQDQDLDQPAKKRPRQRNRIVLSCTECKLRKIKCDRKMPCEACLKRDAGQTCRWENPTAQPATTYLDQQTFNSTIQAIQTRLDLLEQSILSGTAPTVALPPAERRKPSSTLDIQSLPDNAEQENPLEDAARYLESLPTDQQDRRTAAAWQTIEEFTRSSIRLDTAPVALDLRPALPWLSARTIQNAVSALLQILRSQEAAQTLLETLKKSVGSYLGCIHWPSLLRESRAFWQMVSPTEEIMVRPIWLALYATTLALASLFSQDPFYEIQATSLYSIGELSLELADGRNKPSFRLCQTLHIATYFHYNQGQVLAARQLHCMAVSVAQALQLDKLGSDPSRMPVMNDGYPDNTLLAREMGVRMFNDLLCHDIASTSTSRHFATVLLLNWTTCKPRYFADDDLEKALAGETPLGDPANLEACFQRDRAETAEFTREINSLPARPDIASRKFQEYYAILVGLDQAHRKTNRKWLDRQSNTALNWTRLIYMCGFRARMLRLHRPFLIQGYEDHRVRYSTDSCVQDAIQVLAIMCELDSLDSRSAALYFFYRHALSAIVVLAIDAIHDADIGISEAITAPKIAAFASLRDIFGRAATSSLPGVTKIGKTGIVIVDTLLEAVQASRLPKSARNLETYPSILTRIAETVSGAETSTQEQQKQGQELDAQPIQSTMSWLDLLGFEPQSVPSDALPEMRTEWLPSLPENASTITQGVFSLDTLDPRLYGGFNLDFAAWQ